MGLRESLSVMGPRVVAPCFDSILWRLPRHLPSHAVSLTFDDGPHPDSTPRLLETLAGQGLTATFFLLGRNATRYPRLVQDILALGHHLGNHSAEHLDGWRVTRRALWSDIARGSESIARLSQQPVRWVRPPFGHFTWPLIAWSRRKAQRIVMWDAAPPDYNPSQTVDDLIRAWWQQVRSRSIILLHDNEVSAHHTPELLKQVLPQMRDRGYEFVPLPMSAAFSQKTPLT